MGVPYPVLTRLIHPAAHSHLLLPSCPCLGTRAFSARLHTEYCMPGAGEGCGSYRENLEPLYVIACPQEQGRNAVLDPEDQPRGCHLLRTCLPSSRQLHEEVLSTPAALLYHSPLPGTSSWLRPLASAQLFLWVMWPWAEGHQGRRAILPPHPPLTGGKMETPRDTAHRGQAVLWWVAWASFPDRGSAACGCACGSVA